MWNLWIILEKRNRPVNITLPSSEMVMKILRPTTELKNIDAYKTVYLASAKTPLQSSIYKSLKKQLSNRIAAGESNIHIRYLHGTPKIVICTQESGKLNSLNRSPHLLEF